MEAFLKLARLSSLTAALVLAACSSPATSTPTNNNKYATPCLSGSKQCGTTCVNLNEDQLNCGACGNACGAGKVCSNGQCAETCGAGLTECGGSCVNVQTDNQNCGSCANACDLATQNCAAGACQTWEAVSDAGTGEGLTGYTPAGSLPIYSTGDAIYQFDGDGGFKTLVSSAGIPGGYAYGARGADHVYWLGTGQFYSYPSIDGGVTVTAVGDLPSMGDNQSTLDDSNNVWTVASNGKIVKYNLDAGTVTLLDGGQGVPGNGGEPRIAWDSLTQKIYFADYEDVPFFSLDPKTNAVAALPQIPDPNGMNDAFCSDHKGHIFTLDECGGDADNNAGAPYLYTFDAVRGSWAVQQIPFTLGCSGSCSVSGDGFLYLLNGDNGTMFRIRIF